MDELTALNFATLVIATIGAVTGVFAIIWNVVQFRLAGPRIKVEVTEAMTDGAGMIYGPGIWNNSAQIVTQMPGAEMVVAVEVVNTGRAAATVDSVDLWYSNGTVYKGPVDEFRLDSHSRHTWPIPFALARGVVVAFTQTNTPTDNKVYGIATLATGKKVKSKNFITFPP